MVGQMIEEYLVGLGVHIDKPGFQQANDTINNLSGTIQQATGSWVASFAKAGAAVTAAITGIATASAGLMKSAASQELAMQKLGRQMMVDTDTAWEMKRATDALGESLQDIRMNPELAGQFAQLRADGAQMKVGGDFKEIMKGFRSLMFEFTRLKQEVSYAMTWVGYYLMKYLSRPLAQAKEVLKGFNDSFVKNMSVWTEKVARAIYYVINVGIHLLEFIRDLGKAAYSFWDSFPKGVKIATIALLGFWAVLKMSPLGRIMTLVAGLLLLIDDYYGYMEGKQAQFGEYWDKLNTFLEIAKAKFTELKAFVEPFFDRFVGYLGEAKDGAGEFAGKIKGFIADVGNSEGLQLFVGILKDLGESVFEILAGAAEVAKNTIKAFFSAVSKHDIVGKFGEALTKVLRVFKLVSGAIKSVVKWLAKLWREVSKTEEYRDFIDCIGELAGAVLELFGVIVDLVEVAFKGLFGQVHREDEVYSFRDCIRAVLKVFTLIVKTVTSVIRLFTDLLALMRDSQPFVKFWEMLGGAIDKALEKVGKFGRACYKLAKGDFAGAKAELFGGNGKTQGNTDAEVNARAKTAWDEAQRIAADLDVNPQVLYGQWYHETGGFTSKLTRENNNLGGITQTEWNGDDNKQPDGNGYYMEFDSIRDYADYYKRIWGPYIKGIKDSATMAAVLKSEGYYGADQSEYQSGIENGMDHIPANPNPMGADEVTYLATDGNTRGRLDIKTGLDDSIANEGLKEKATNFYSALRDNGYNITIESASINSLGITVSGDDWWNVIGMAEHFGMSASHDEHGFYLSDPDYDGSQNMSYNSATRVKGERGYSIQPLGLERTPELDRDIRRGVLTPLEALLSAILDELRALRVPKLDIKALDPNLLGGLLGGAMTPVPTEAPANTTVTYSIDVGGVTVQGGANTSAEDIGRAVADQALKRLEGHGEYLLRSRNLVGAIM